MRIHGRCHCGQVSYTAEVDPSAVSVCHCSDCQTFSGAPFRASVRAHSAQVQFQGQAREYVKTAASGRPRVQGFCGHCGSALYATALHDRSVLGLRLGCVAERAQLAPQAQVWAGSAMPWLRALLDLPAREGGPDSAACRLD